MSNLSQSSHGRPLTLAGSDVEFASPLAGCDTLSPPYSLASCRGDQGSTQRESCSTVSIRYLPCSVPAAAVRNGWPSAPSSARFWLGLQLMASHRLSETYRQSKREVGGAAQSSKSKASKATVARQSDSVETPREEQAQKLLRQFDLTAKYGPCTNVSRRQRWERASKLGLDPPQGVLQALEQLDASHPEQQGIWADRT